MARSWQLLVSAVAVGAISLAVVCLLFAGIHGAWHSLLAMFVQLAAYAVAALGLLLLIRGAIAGTRPYRWLAGVVVAAGTIGTAQYTSNFISRTTRASQIQAALDAGLESDCRLVFAKYQDDPRLVDDGYLRVFRGSDEFNTLPSSIRMLKPGYVTIEDHPFGGSMPRNIGLCKNGFGGFAFGVRVFLVDESFPEPFWKKRVTPSVYLWQEET